MRNYNQNVTFGPMFSTVAAMMSPAHQTITRQPLYDQVAPLAIRPSIREITTGIYKQFMRWQGRANQRRILKELDDHMLQDIGLERFQAAEEAAKPFWRA